jgi:hypothetical protein
MSAKGHKQTFQLADSRVSVKANIERQLAALLAVAIVSRLVGLGIMPAFKLKSYQAGE